MGKGTGDLGWEGETAALLEMARALAATNDLDKLLSMVVSCSMSLLDAERATLFLYDKDSHELYSRISEGIAEVRIPADAGLAGAAATSMEIVNVPDAYADDRFNREVDKRSGYRTRSVLACPLADYEGQLVGVLQILNKRAGSFTGKDESLAAALGAQAGVALQRAHLLSERLEKERMEHAMAVAQEIQQGLFPREDPCVAGFDVSCWNRPCDATGGDCCDFVELTDGRALLMVGDASGHGVGPALVSCTARAMVRALSNVKEDVSEITGLVNLMLAGDLASNRFVTAFMGVLDGSTGVLDYCSAGQAPLLWYHAAEDRVDSLDASGIPLGIMDDYEYEPAEPIRMQPGDIFALLTDGFYEWARSDGQMFGSARAVETIIANKHCGAADIMGTIIQAVHDFADTKQADDLTAVIIKRPV